MLRTQVIIVGAGPAGLLLSQLLDREGIASIVLEHRSRAHVESRIRAGVLEPGTVELLREAGVAGRLMRERLVHEGFRMTYGDESLRIDLKALAGQAVSVYGQTEVTRDLIDARTAAGADLRFEVGDVALEGLSSAPRVRFRDAGGKREIACDFIAGCDGYHGVCRRTVPADAIRIHEHTHRVAWLGLLADVPPAADELIYAGHERGFALCSMRSHHRSRYYIQCAADERLGDWPDARFWDELRSRLPAAAAAAVVSGPALEKSIAPLRGFVAEPMRFGRLFLAGDSAHIVPPTGAKGLNLAAADVRLLHRALVDHYRAGRDHGLETYSERALRRVWQAQRFSWWLTAVTHRLSDDTFARRLQRAELDRLSRSRAAQAGVAESYVGLPFDE